MTPRRRARPPLAIVAGLLAMALALPTLVVNAAAGPEGDPGAGRDAGAASSPRQTLLRYARDTWASIVAMTDPATGLPSDSLLSDGTASVQTSTTNIGAYLWSTLVADELRLISHNEAVARLDRTLTTLATMERHVAERPVLQLVRPPDRSEAHRLAALR